MAWTTPMTFVAGTTLTAAQLNTHLRDNLGETAPGKATTAGRIFVTTGANAIAERVISENAIATGESTTSTSYVDLTTVGPSQTVTTGTRALVFFRVSLFNSGTNNTLMSVAVSGATTLAASDSWALTYVSPVAGGTGAGFGMAYLFTGLTAGSNTFTAKYRVSAGTGSFSLRELVVMGL